MRGTGFTDYGGLLCRFGPAGRLDAVSATMQRDGSVACWGNNEFGQAPTPTL